MFVTVAHAADPCSVPNFAVATNLSVGAPNAIAIDDFNKDGKPDLAVAGSFGTTPIKIFLSDGNGGFGAGPSLAARSPTSIVSGDLNGDGNADLVIGNGSNTEGELSIFLGNGAGGFGPRIQKFIISGTQDIITAVAIADFNGDGKPDVAALSSTFHSVFILTGDGSGNFTFLRSLSSGGSSPFFLMVRDVNGDSKADLLIANTGNPNNIAILLGDGTGNFAAPVTLLAGSNPGSFDVADLDGDSKLDLAVTFGDTVAILRGDGSGNFGNQTNSSLSGNLGASPKAADFNGDGKLDLAFATPMGSLMIALGDGAGGFHVVAAFTSIPSLQSGPNAVAVADLNGDTRPEVLVVSNGQSRVSVFLNTCGTAVPSQIQLNAEGYAVFESDPSIIPSVVRSGDITGAASVQYSTSDGSAVSPQDYTAVSGTLNFAPGEISKSVTIPIVNDGVPEATENFSFALTGASGGTLLGPSLASITILDDDSSQVLFTSASLSVGEGSGAASISVSRTGNTSLAGSVDYATSDTAGNANCNAVSTAASSRCDYMATSGTVSFAPGEIEKFILVPIIDDSYKEGTERFTLTLSNPSNGFLLGSRTTTDVLISDNDSVDGPNPIDVASFFVRQQYLDFLNRQPDQSGGDFWTNQITSCGSDLQCIEVKRVNTSGAFFLSIEFQQTGNLVYKMYKAGFGNLPGKPVAADRAPFMTDTRQVQSTPAQVIVGQGNWQAQLETNKQAFALAFVQRASFQTAHSGQTADQYVNSLFTNTGASATAAEVSAAVNAFNTAGGGDAGRAAGLRSVAESGSVAGKLNNEAFVLMQYFGYLQRNPDDPPEATHDYSGFSFWLGKLNQFNGDFIAAEMVKAFISSGEYRQRFGP